MDKVISGAMLRKMVISGANYLEENNEYVNSLNVFPVPDGDTGSNMSMTLENGAAEIEKKAFSDVYTLATAFSTSFVTSNVVSPGLVERVS